MHHAGVYRSRYVGAVMNSEETQVKIIDSEPVLSVSESAGNERGC